MATENDKQSDVAGKSLNEWQHYIAEHFSGLSNLRKNRNLSVFALEHNLSIAQLEDIRFKLKRQIVSQETIRTFWLPWVIYATELGYEYDGEEYWQSFESSTPLWNFSSREDIRWAFNQFQKKYNGVTPSGKWANHFSIISWPITHAILPKDLQSHFARLLYSTRFQISKAHCEDAESMGHVLAANSYQVHSTRFHNFLEQAELVGRIAFAMLKDRSNQNESDLIYDSTLIRLVTDLEKKYSAGEWIRMARGEVKARILGTGTQNILYPRDPLENTDITSRKRIVTKPKLSLQRTGKSNWILIIEISNFSASVETPESLSFLESTRFRLSGAKSNWLPCDVLLNGTFRQRLSDWPRSNELIKFEKLNESFEDLIKSDYNISEAFPLVFRVESDGRAREVVGKLLRPGSEYILLFIEETPIPAELASISEIECTRIIGRTIKVASNPTDQELKLYRDIGLQVSKTIKVWPAGLSARNWDGEGVSEWLTTEWPSFGIVHDHPVKNYEVHLGTLSLFVNAKEPGVPIFIKLPQLPTGRHVLHVLPKSEGISEPSEGIILLEVREPVPWTPGTTLHNGLSAFLDPLDDDIDSFLTGKTQLRIYGPKERSVSIQFDFYAAGQLLGSVGPKTINLPLSTKELRSFCSEVIKDENLQIARNMSIVISADDLGIRVLNLQRDIEPIRWFYTSKNNSAFLRLIDETDNSDTAQVSIFTVNDPTTELKVSVQEWSRKKDIHDVKGLIRFKKTNFERSIIVSHLESTKSFDAFNIIPHISEYSDDKVLSFSKSAGHAKMWYNARCANFVAQLHRQKVIDTFTNHIISFLCGRHWPIEENRFLSNPSIERAIAHFEEKIGNRHFANIMGKRLLNKNPSEIRPDEEKAWFLGAVIRYKICEEKPLAYFALQLASNPFLIDEFFQGNFSKNLIEILRNKLLMRCARFYALVASRLIDPEKPDALISPTGLRWK